MCASVALVVAALPTVAFAGTAVTAAISAPPGDVVAGSTVQIVCWAEGSPSMGQPTNALSVDVTVSDGTVSPAQLTGAVSAPCSFDGARTCSLIQGSAAWTTPPAPGALTATCTGTFQGTFGGPQVNAATATLTTVAGTALPPVVSPIDGPNEVVAGAAAAFQVVASDPNDPPQPLTYTWSATGGTITPDPANAAVATWQAPDAPGAYELAVSVSNGAVSSLSSRLVSVVLAEYQASLAVPLSVPRRLCTGDAGALYVVDGRQGSYGRVGLLTPRGETRGFAVVPEPVLAVAHGAGLLWVTTTKGSLYQVDPTTGRTAGKVPLADGPLAQAFGIAFDAANMTLWIAETDANRVRLVHPDGSTVAMIQEAGGAPLVAPTDVAIDAAAGRAWVLVAAAKKESGLVAGEPVAAARFLHAFDLAAGYVGSYVANGGAPGQLTRAGGLAVSGGKIYASDVFQGTVQVLDGAAAPLATIGAFGGAQGQLLNPMGLAVMGNGDLAVANASQGKIERFGNGAALPTCPGDTDCDGLPDAWEVAHGLDPTWAGDALVDLDGDGLTNIEEYAHGTDPRNPDTDGDGYSDGAEAFAGQDPTNPNDHAPVVAASGPADSPPGLVRLSGVASGQGTCSLAWAQAGGPAVTLHEANTGSPWFIAREAATYAFDAVAQCAGVATAPARVNVAVHNVAPRADAGRVRVASPGSLVALDALASSDANGDALAFSWDQTLGPATTATAGGGVLTAKPRGVGLYAYQVTVSDPAGAASTAEVPVLVAAGPAPTAVAAASPSEAVVGANVVLDASASLADAGATYHWQQVAGPAAEIAAADQAAAWFAPPSAGRYAFEVTVGDGRLRSPPARVDVFVAEAGGALPTVTASAPSIVAVNTAAALEATGSGAGLSYEWRQVSGPAAGLTDADLAGATVVPFEPGFYVFEVSVKDGAAQSRPARVAFEARAGGQAIPRAQIAVAAGDAIVGQLVFLDGRASVGAARFRWTQVGGPWVALGPERSVISFRPLVPGRYAFELEVDDGVVRSAPSRVEVNVVSAEGVR